MVWGCMSSHGVGRLHIVSGTVKAMDYIEILQIKLLPTTRNLLGISYGYFTTITPLSSCKEDHLEPYFANACDTASTSSDYKER
ncbi:hypothetical protein TNCV_1071251 [Trichonephila clavipes]|nr:hypothetical protein TNCV_1071251 [Trichonephila clavipes]